MTSRARFICACTKGFAHRARLDQVHRAPETSRQRLGQAEELLQWRDPRGRIEFDQEIGVAAAGIEIRAPRGGSEHLQPRHAVPPAEGAQFRNMFGDVGVHGRQRTGFPRKR